MDTSLPKATGLNLFPRQPAQNSISLVSFPYEVSAKELPDRLPTTAEIETSDDVLLHRGGAKIVGVGLHFIVKYGHGVDLEEGRTMMYVRERTTVDVPRVYALFNDLETGKNYIIMERIQGKTLEDVWSSLNTSEKKELGLQIKEYLSSLRQLQSKTFCSVANKPLRDGVFWTADKTVNYAGPFDSESHLYNTIIKIYKLSKSKMVQGKAEYCERVFPSELRGSKSVFTHGDLQRKNIMVRIESGLKKGLVLIDWETGGFYPEYWEYSRAYRSVRFDDDWESYLHEILEPFPREYNMLSVVFDDLSC